MKRTKNNIIPLTSLYLNYIFSKTTLIILGISLLLMVLALVFISNPAMSEAEYLLGSDEVHNNYFRLAGFIIQVFNSIIISTIIITVIINSVSFDSLFIADNKRYIICISKLLSIFIIMTLITIFEVIILYLIPLIHFPLYKPELKDYLLIIYLLIIDFVEITLSILLSTILGTIFIPMGILFISIIIKIICQSILTFKTMISIFIPIIEVEGGGLVTSGAGVGLIWIILFTFLYFSVYNIRDLKQM